MALTGDFTPPLTLEQLVYLFRQRMDDLPGDVASPSSSWQNDDAALLWGNEEIAGYADEAQRELAHRKPILDSLTAAVTQIAVTAATQAFTYDPRILKIDRVKFVETASADEYVLSKRDQHAMDRDYLEWDLEGSLATPGTPCFYVDYFEERQLKLYPVPDVVGTLHLTVWRLPLNRLSWTLRSRLIEANQDHQIDLLDWMQYRAYLKRDAETENPNLAGQHKAIFDERIGERPSAKLQAVRRREHRMGRRVKAHFV